MSSSSSVVYELVCTLCNARVPTGVNVSNTSAAAEEGTDDGKGESNSGSPTSGCNHTDPVTGKSTLAVVETTTTTTSHVTARPAESTSSIMKGQQQQLSHHVVADTSISTASSSAVSSSTTAATSASKNNTKVSNEETIEAIVAAQRGTEVIKTKRLSSRSPSPAAMAAHSGGSSSTTTTTTVSFSSPSNPNSRRIPGTTGSHGVPQRMKQPVSILKGPNNNNNARRVVTEDITVESCGTLESRRSNSHTPVVAPSPTTSSVGELPSTTNGATAGTGSVADDDISTEVTATSNNHNNSGGGGSPSTPTAVSVKSTAAQTPMSYEEKRATLGGRYCSCCTPTYTCPDHSMLSPGDKHMLGGGGSPGINQTPLPPSVGAATPVGSMPSGSRGHSPLQGNSCYCTVCHTSYDPNVTLWEEHVRCDVHQAAKRMIIEREHKRMINMATNNVSGEGVEKKASPTGSAGKPQRFIVHRKPTVLDVPKTTTELTAAATAALKKPTTSTAATNTNMSIANNMQSPPPPLQQQQQQHYQFIMHEASPEYCNVSEGGTGGGLGFNSPIGGNATGPSNSTTTPAHQQQQQYYYRHQSPLEIERTMNASGGSGLFNITAATTSVGGGDDLSGREDVFQQGQNTSQHQSMVSAATTASSAPSSMLSPQQQQQQLQQSTATTASSGSMAGAGASTHGLLPSSQNISRVSRGSESDLLSAATTSDEKLMLLRSTTGSSMNANSSGHTSMMNQSSAAATSVNCSRCSETDAKQEKKKYLKVLQNVFQETKQRQQKHVLFLKWHGLWFGKHMARRVEELQQSGTNNTSGGPSHQHLTTMNLDNDECISNSDDDDEGGKYYGHSYHDSATTSSGYKMESTHQQQSAQRNEEESSAGFLTADRGYVKDVVMDAVKEAIEQSRHEEEDAAIEAHRLKERANWREEREELRRRRLEAHQLTSQSSRRDWQLPPVDEQMRKQLRRAAKEQHVPRPMEMGDDSALLLKDRHSSNSANEDNDETDSWNARYGASGSSPSYSRHGGPRQSHSGPNQQQQQPEYRKRGAVGSSRSVKKILERLSSDTRSAVQHAVDTMMHQEARERTQFVVKRSDGVNSHDHNKRGSPGGKVCEGRHSCAYSTQMEVERERRHLQDEEDRKRRAKNRALRDVADTRSETSTGFASPTCSSTLHAAGDGRSCQRAGKRHQTTCLEDDGTPRSGTVPVDDHELPESTSKHKHRTREAHFRRILAERQFDERQRRQEPTGRYNQQTTTTTSDDASLREVLEKELLRQVRMAKHQEQSSFMGDARVKRHAQDGAAARGRSRENVSTKEARSRSSPKPWVGAGVAQPRSKSAEQGNSPRGYPPRSASPHSFNATSLTGAASQLSSISPNNQRTTSNGNTVSFVIGNGSVACDTCREVAGLGPSSQRRRARSTSPLHADPFHPVAIPQPKKYGSQEEVVNVNQDAEYLQKERRQQSSKKSRKATTSSAERDDDKYGCSEAELRSYMKHMLWFNLPVSREDGAWEQYHNQLGEAIERLVAFQNMQAEDRARFINAMQKKDMAHRMTNAPRGPDVW